MITLVWNTSYITALKTPNLSKRSSLSQPNFWKTLAWFTWGASPQQNVWKIRLWMHASLTSSEQALRACSELAVRLKSGTPLKPPTLWNSKLDGLLVENGGGRGGGRVVNMSKFDRFGWKSLIYFGSLWKKSI